MADNAPSWTDILSAFLAYPEKIALLLVLFAGAWRWLRELWVERKDDSHHESIIEILMKENRELRGENKGLREELRKHQDDDR